MIIHINGLPGVGKLTVARALTGLIGGWLVDNHTVYNLAFSLAPFRSKAFYDLARAVRDVAYGRIVDLNDGQPVVLTNSLTRSCWGEENWRSLVGLAERSHRQLRGVTLICDPGEHHVRLRSPDRAYLGKLTDPSRLRLGQDDLLKHEACQSLRLDVTGASPEVTAAAIAAWARTKVD